jgi:RNase H-like domain found in reverse transcriptase/Reverse transcriptase (RNA-dependent DNA polymerase)/Integrase zinc binding domain/Retroviral aspartyl protease
MRSGRKRELSHLPPEPGSSDSNSQSESDSFNLAQVDMSAKEEEGEIGFLNDRLLVHGVTVPSSDHRQLMVFQGSVNGHQAVILLDSGANSNFVSKAWAESKGISSRPLGQSTEVTTATGGTYTATTQLMSTDVRVVGKDVKANLVILPLVTYDVILGVPWFRQTRPVFDWGLWTCNGRAVYSKGGRSVGHPGRTARRLQAMAVGPAGVAAMDRLTAKYGRVFATELPKRVVSKSAMVHSFLMQEGCVPIRDGERRRSPEELRLAREMVREGEASGIIEDSKSEWCSQLVMVVKKDQYGKPTGKPRFCVDYRRVNALMRKDSHPLPLPESMFSQLTGAKVFSKLDLTKGFYQIGLDPACREYLAFSTPDGPKQWTVMPFGIANAPATFQREMQRILRDRLDVSVMVYIDDILIFSKNQADHEEHVEWVLQQLMANGYYANPDKCEFWQSQVNFLGHVIKEGGLAVQKHKVDSIVQWPTPECVKDVRSFLGLTGYYRRFVEGYSAMAKPLTDLTHNDTPFVWGENEMAAFMQLKQSLAQAPTLATPDSSKPYVLHTDASGYAVGATLSQDLGNGRGLQPVAFMSKKMSPAQRHYAVHEWELLAVVEALRAWRCYLYGSAHAIEIFTDHHSLQYINTQPNLSARQCRWVELLQDYTFKIRHIAGDRNVVADALSRRSDHELAHVQENEARLRAGLKGASGTGLPRLQLEVAAVRTRSSSSSTKTRPSPEVVTGPAVSTSTEGSRSSVVAPSLMFDIRRAAETDVNYQELVARHEHYGLIVQDGLVYSTSGLLYIPQDSELRTTLMREVHDAPTGGHLGREKTYARLTAAVYWRGVYNDVRDYVSSCVSCARNKSSNRSQAGLLHPLPIPARRWETISMDFVGPMPKTTSGYDWLLVVVDKFSKMVHLIACKTTMTAADVARLVYDHVIRLHGFPDSIISDRDTRFTSHFWAALWKLTGHSAQDEHLLPSSD